MLDITKEHVLSLKEAAAACPALDGKKPHLSTVWRWMQDGVRGHRLEYIRVGRRVCTTQEALHRFFERAAQPISPRATTADRPQTNRQRAASMDAARERLAAKGLGTGA